MPRNSTDGVGLAATGIGAVLIYAGIKGYSVLAVLQNLVTGKPITTGVVSTVSLTASDASGDIQTGVDRPSNAGGTGGVSGNQAIAKSLAASYGWDNGSEWTALVELWRRESSWNNHALNPSSGAYGIPQALPHTKMPKAAWPESAGGTSDASTQITWGLNYIKGRYGRPSVAVAFHDANNWY